MLTAMPPSVVVSVVGRPVRKVTPALLHVGYLVGTANGQLHKYNYRVDTPKMTSLGKY